MADQPQRVLVTGGSGYFGSFLVNRVRQSPHGALRVFDLYDADDRAAEVEFVRGDIRDREAVQMACRDMDVVYHCVAQVPLARDRELFESVNVQGTENLLRACVDQGVGKLVYLSSSAVFGIPERNPVDESMVPRPLEDYGRAKLEGEEIAVRYHREHGLDVTLIRPRTILGHGRLGIFEILFDWIASGKDVYVLGGGNNVYQFVHAEDLAEACVLAGNRPGFATYNVGAERFGTMRESISGLVEHAGTGSRVRSLPMGLTAAAMKTLSGLGLAPFAPYHWLMYGRELYFDIRRAQEELRWQPRWGNVEMLCDSYDWFLENRHRIVRYTEGSPHRSGTRQGILKLVKALLP